MVAWTYSASTRALFLIIAGLLLISAHPTSAARGRNLLAAVSFNGIRIRDYANATPQKGRNWKLEARILKCTKTETAWF